MSEHSGPRAMPSPPRIIDDLWGDRDREPPKPRRIEFVDDSVPEQAAFIRDPARKRLIFCTRRGGKSYGEGRLMCQEAHNNAAVSCLYIGLTRESAWRTMWRDVLKRLNRELHLGATFNETKLLMTLPNESTVQLLGLDATDDEKAKLLGGKYKVVVIDEAASFTIDLQALIYDTLGPAVADLDGIIVMSSTPTNIHAGLFFDMTKEHDPMAPGRWTFEDWSCHRWSYEQNPYIRAKVERDIAELVAKKPNIEKTPGFQQMWKGRWTVDPSKLVYKFQLGLNSFNGALPRFKYGGWHYSLGIDTGWKASAFTLEAYHDHSPDLFILESWKRRGLDVTAMAEVVDWYRSRFELEMCTVDGANKQAVEEMNKRHGLTLVAADKRDKFEFIDLMNDDFVRRRIYVSNAEWEPELVHRFTDVGICGAEEYVSRFKCGLLVGEFAKLVLDERKLLKLRKREEHPNCENHCCDSAYYGWRTTYPYLSTREKQDPPPIGTVEWHAYEAQRQLEREEQLLNEEIAASQAERDERADLADLL